MHLPLPPEVPRANANLQRLIGCWLLLSPFPCSAKIVPEKGSQLSGEQCDGHVKKTSSFFLQERKI